MQRLRTEILFDQGNVAATPAWARAHADIHRAVAQIEHPAGTGRLTLRRKIATGRRGATIQWQRNGVGALRRSFLAALTRDAHWRAEGAVAVEAEHLATNVALYPDGERRIEPRAISGDFDFVTDVEGLRVAVEWETGNVSSSHRSMNKLCICLAAGTIAAGVMIVPSRACYSHLTDRIGNVDELAPYITLWQSSRERVARGLLAIVVVEHDEISDDPAIPFLGMGDDGNALRARE